MGCRKSVHHSLARSLFLDVSSDTNEFFYLDAIRNLSVIHSFRTSFVKPLF